MTEITRERIEAVTAEARDQLLYIPVCSQLDNEDGQEQQQLERRGEEGLQLAPPSQIEALLAELTMSRSASESLLFRRDGSSNAPAGPSLFEQCEALSMMKVERSKSSSSYCVARPIRAKRGPALR